MPSYTIDDQIRARVEEFVSELTELVRAAALEAVGTALGDAGRPSPPVRRGRKAARKKAAGAGRGGRRGRRSGADIESLAEGFAAYVASNPGQRLEVIAREMGMDTQELKQPVALLESAGRIKKQGKARGTTYHVGSGKGGAKRKAKKAGVRRKKKAGRKAARRKTAAKA